MNSIRNRLVVIFVLATIAPLAATWWIATALLEHSATLANTDQLDTLSKTLERTGRALYQQVRDSLEAGVAAGRIGPLGVYELPGADWPEDVRAFWESGEAERFSVVERSQNRDGGAQLMLYYVRRAGGVAVYAKPFPAVSLARLRGEYRSAREAVAEARAHDIGAGLVRTFAVLVGVVWALSLALLVFLAHRVSRPIQQLTAGLARLAAGDLSTRIPPAGTDETGRAIQAFNETAAELESNRDRMVYLAQLASWRQLARKMAHELKNSLTPIRLTMEEVIARRGGNDREFVEQAAGIVVDEVESMERRVRAFSEFSADPPVRLVTVDLNDAVRERVMLLKAGRPGVRYETRLAPEAPVRADADLVKGILTNLLENAADAAGPGGTVLVVTAAGAVEVHDSGPGLSEEALRHLFEPTISFKKHGMGLGLSIVRKNALLCGGDIETIAGELGGAAFRVTLPVAEPVKKAPEASAARAAVNL